MLLLLASIGLLGGSLLLTSEVEEDESASAAVDSVDSQEDEETSVRDLIEIVDLGSSADGNNEDRPEENTTDTRTTGFDDSGLREDHSSGSGESSENNSVASHGTAGNDTITGVSVHIDEASKIVTLQGNSADEMNGGDGDDVLLLGEGDIATGGRGFDEFVIDGDIQGTDIEIPKIIDFDVETDVIHISLPTPENLLAKVFPDRPDFEGEIGVEYGDNTTHISVNGSQVCELQGVHDIDRENIKVLYDYHANVPTDFQTEYGYI